MRKRAKNVFRPVCLQQITEEKSNNAEKAANETGEETEDKQALRVCVCTAWI